MSLTNLQQFSRFPSNRRLWLLSPTTEFVGPKAKEVALTPTDVILKYEQWHPRREVPRSNSTLHGSWTPFGTPIAPKISPGFFSRRSDAISTEPWLVRLIHHLPLAFREFRSVH